MIYLLKLLIILNEWKSMLIMWYQGEERGKIVLKKNIY